MSLAGVLLGLINIAIVVAVLLLIGAIILWFCSWMGIAVPANVQKGYIAVVALIGFTCSSRCCLAYRRSASLARCRG